MTSPPLPRRCVNIPTAPASSRCSSTPSQPLQPRPNTPQPCPGVPGAPKHSTPGLSQHIPFPPVPPALFRCPTALQARLDVSQCPQPHPSVSLRPHSTPTLSHCVPIPIHPYPTASWCPHSPPNPYPAAYLRPHGPPALSQRSYPSVPSSPSPVPKVSQLPPAPSLRRYPPPWLNRPARPPPIRARTPRNHAPLREHVTWCPPRGASGPIGGAALPQLSAHPRVTVSPR